MRRLSPLLSSLVIAVLAMGALLFVQYRRDDAALRAAERAEQQTRERYGQAIADIAAIQDSLNAISFEGGAEFLRSAPLTAERNLSPMHGDEALARVAELRSGIERARGRIEQLERLLHRSGHEVAGLERMLTNLKSDLAAKEQRVAELSARNDSLQTHVSGLAATVEEKQTQLEVQAAALEDRRRELGTVFYVIGTRDELLKSGTVVARGGVFGLGKTLDPSGKLDEHEFIAVDTDVQSVIPIAARSARVLTPQPAGSYLLEPVNGQLELRILDAHEFRKVRQLVIVKA
jgi:hypothetical protein